MADQSQVDLGWRHDSDLQGEGLLGIEILGEAARPAIPQLKRLFQTEQSGGINSAGMLLERFGREGYQALADGLTNENVSVRIKTLEFLNFVAIGSRTTNKEPKLVAEFRHNAEVAIPALLVALNDKNQEVVHGAVTELSAIHREPELVIPALERVANDPINGPTVREAAVSALANFGIEGGKSTVTNNPAAGIQKK
jgi:hypothetical protein